MGMAKYDRLLFILNLLRSRRNFNARMLADRCGVNERTIYRDMIAISQAHIPIYYDRGYKLASDNFLPTLNFDYDEYQFMKIALGSSPLAKTDKYNSVVKKVMAKIEAGLSSEVKRHRLFTPETTSVELPYKVEKTKAAKYFGLIESAILTGKCLKLIYYSINSGDTERIVDPYFIIFRGHAFYFVAKCHLRNEIRTFRIDRVKDITITDDIFIPDDEITPDDYFAHSWEVFKGKPIEIKVRFTGKSARVVLSTPHHPNEEIEQLDNDSLIYTVTTAGLDEIRRWILGFGNEAEVLTPPELKKQICDICKKLSREI